jgi:LysR family transcriptional regulator, regulator for metE and metH
MEIKHLKLVATIAEVGSLTKAADRLFLTQSALSHQLKEIETQLETKLFDRINKRLVLTGAGNILLRSSKNILNEVERAKKQINQHLSGESGRIRLSIQCYTSYHWLPYIIKNYQHEYPNIDISIKNDKFRNPIELLLAGKLDLAIVFAKKSDKNIEYTELFTDELVAVTSQGNVLAAREYLKPYDFRDVSFITNAQHFEETRFYTEFLKESNSRPKKLTYIPQTEAIIEMVKADLGITVLTKWLMKPYLNASPLKIVKLGPKGFKRRWYIATLKDSSRAKHLSSFVTHIKDGIFL